MSVVAQSQVCYLGQFESMFPGCGHSYLNQNKLLGLLRAVFSDEIGSVEDIDICVYIFMASSWFCMLVQDLLPKAECFVQ